MKGLFVFGIHCSSVYFWSFYSVLFEKQEDFRLCEKQKVETKNNSNGGLK